MATNVYTKKETDLSKYGFRWCNKDCRWETRRDLDQDDAQQLAQQINAKVEVVRQGRAYLTVEPEPTKDLITEE